MPGATSPSALRVVTAENFARVIYGLAWDVATDEERAELTATTESLLLEAVEITRCGYASVPEPRSGSWAAAIARTLDQPAADLVGEMDIDVSELFADDTIAARVGASGEACS